MTIMKVKQPDGTIVSIPLGVGGGGDAYETSITNTVSGNPIILTEISPLQNQVNVQLKGKNLLDFSVIKPKLNFCISIDDNGNWVVSGNSRGLVTLETSIRVKDLCPNLEVGKTYVLSCKDPDDVFDSFQLNVYYGEWNNPDNPIRMETKHWRKNMPLIITKEILEATVFGINIGFSTSEESVISELQVEEGTIATSFIPYINNFESIKVYDEITLKEYYPDKNGLVHNIVTSHPETRLRADSDTVYIDCEYFKRIGLDYCVETGNIALNNENVINNDISPRLSALETYVYDNDDSVLGLEIDFENNTFTRLAGARGLKPGADFDKYNMYGGRKRCTVNNVGVAEINNWYGSTIEERVLFDSNVKIGFTQEELDEGNTEIQALWGSYHSFDPKIYGKNIQITITVGDQVYSFNTIMGLPNTPMQFDDIAFNDGISTLMIYPQGKSSEEAPIAYDGSFKFDKPGSQNMAGVEIIHIKIICEEYPEFTDDGSGGQVMVYQPKFYYMVVPTKLEKQPVGSGYNIKKVRYYISDKPKAGFKLHPVFYDKDGKEVDYVLYSAYEGGYSTTANHTGSYFNDETDTERDFWNYITSVANVKPVSGQTKPFSRERFQQAAQLRHLNWSVETMKSICANQLLMIIEAGTMNLQGIFGLGIINGENDWTKNLSETTGQTASLGNQSSLGYLMGNYTPEGDWVYSGISYRGIENPWGNIFKHIQGVNIKYGDNGYNKIYIANDFNFDNSKTDDNYEDVGFGMSQTYGGYVSAFGYKKEEFDWLLIPTEFNGTSELPVGDLVTTIPSAEDDYCVAPMTTKISVAGEDGAYTSKFSYDSDVIEINREDAVTLNPLGDGANIRYIKYDITKIIRQAGISEIEVYDDKGTKIQLTTDNLTLKRVFDTGWIGDANFSNPENMVDGNYLTYSAWDQQRNDITEFPAIPRCEITVDLGESKNVSKICIRAGAPYPQENAGIVVGGCWASGYPDAGTFCGEWSIKNDWASYIGARLFYVPHVWEVEEE